MVQIFADSNRARIRTIRSTDGWGTTPVSGKTRELRFTGSTITAQKETQVSDEIRADRMVSDIVEVGAKSQGEINVEFSAGSHDDFMEGFAFGHWSRPMSFDTVKGDILEWHDATTLYVHGKDVSAYFTAGHRVRTDGFIEPSNNAYFEIASVAYDAPTNKTTFVMTAGAAVAEEGSAVSALYDANDVVVLANTHVRAGTGGAATFDTNGTNAFAAAIAAGQLAVGQKVFVESPLGLEHGTVAFAAQPAAGDKVRVSDGVNSVTYQFGGVASNAVQVVEIGATADDTGANFAELLNAARATKTLSIKAVSADAVTGGSATPTTVTVTNLNGTGGALTNVTGAATVVAFAAGDATQRGVFKLLAVTNDVLTVSPAPATNANAAGAPITIKGAMLRNPSNPEEIVAPDIVYEVGFTDVGQYFLVDGLKVSSMKYEVTSGQILKGSFGMNGRKTIRQSTSKLGDAVAYTPLATTATDVINATVNVGEIKINGAALSTAVQSISFDGENNLRDQMAVSSKFPVGIGAGRMDIKGSAKVYFADGSMWDKFINHETVSIEFSFEDGEHNHYEWTIPSAVFSTDTVNPAAGNQDVMEDIEYMAKRDPATDCQFQIDRFSNVSPVTA